MKYEMVVSHILVEVMNVLDVKLTSGQNEQLHYSIEQILQRQLNRDSKKLCEALKQIKQDLSRNVEALEIKIKNFNGY